MVLSPGLLVLRLLSSFDSPADLYVKVAVEYLHGYHDRLLFENFVNYLAHILNLLLASNSRTKIRS
jgi:hypothetical protein